GITVESLSGGSQTLANLIQGNYIGIGADGITPLGNGGSGILLEGAESKIIGGTNPGQGNLIAYNHGPGISTLTLSGTNTRKNSIRGNSIFSNDGLGIDLA